MVAAIYYVINRMVKSNSIMNNNSYNDAKNGHVKCRNTSSVGREELIIRVKENISDYE